MSSTTTTTTTTTTNATTEEQASTSPSSSSQLLNVKDLSWNRERHKFRKLFYESECECNWNFISRLKHLNVYNFAVFMVVKT